MDGWYGTKLGMREYQQVFGNGFQIKQATTGSTNFTKWNYDTGTPEDMWNATFN
jgi:hypothetical protein